MDKQNDFEKGWEEYRTKKRQEIEELIGIIQGAVGGCATHWASLIAEEVLKYYQPKIHEGAVVLTGKELEEKIDCCNVSMIHHDEDGKRYVEYVDYKDFTDRLGKRIRQLKGQLKQTHKETAEKFAERLKEKLGEFFDDNEDNDGKINKAILLIDVIGVVATDGEIISLGLIDKICNEIIEGEIK